MNIIKITASIFIILVVFLYSVVFVESANPSSRPRLLQPNNRILLQPNERPTLQVQTQLSNLPVLENELFELIIRAEDDRGVKGISIAPSFGQLVIQRCIRNGRYQRSCEKMVAFRMPRGQQQFIISAVDEEDQLAIKTVNVNVLPVNQDVDVSVTELQRTPESLEELPNEVELSVTVDGPARGRLCYRADFEFSTHGIDETAVASSSFDCDDDVIRTELENGQFTYRTTLDAELFRPVNGFEGVHGEYHANIEVWLEDENGRRVFEDNENNNWYRIDVDTRENPLVNQNIDVSVIGPQLTEEDIEELPVELELLVTIEGNAEGMLCYAGEYDFVGANYGEHEESSFGGTRCEPVQSINENGQARFERIIRLELFDGVEDGQSGTYAVEFEAWLQENEDEGGRIREEIHEENEENNGYESIVVVV